MKPRYKSQEYGGENGRKYFIQVVNIFMSLFSAILWCTPVASDVDAANSGMPYYWNCNTVCKLQDKNETTWFIVDSITD